MKISIRNIVQNSFLFGMLVLALIFGCAESTGTQNDSSTQSPKSVAEKKVKKKLTLGERVFIMCGACHSLKKGEPHKVGPNLNGLFGSKAAVKEGFTYSQALMDSEIVWNEDHLRNWLKKPTDYIPGTTMAFIGLQDDDQITALIDYLKEQTK